MAQGARQSSLFAAEDFSVIYESFAQANFQAYDFDTIRTAMVEYINTNYPESFNDWISSSEFVSLIELMAFLGHNLAFRADLGTRENYLSTAERRESALRIADFLSYRPTRNSVANGLLKIDTIKTTEEIYSTNGDNLASVDIQFEDTTDPDTNQNFLTVMNSIMQTSSKIGSPFARYTENNVVNEIYRTNSFQNDVTQSFSSIVNGSRINFDIHSVYYNQNSNLIEEKTPDPYGYIDFLYRNDNGGISSSNTGFFVGFKQGNLQYEDFVIDTGIENLVLDINVDNIAHNNLWVQTIDELGQVQKTWTQIDKLYGLNAVFNAVNNNQRDIYTVSTRDNDQISLVFADGQFGNIPRGIIRVWYRTGINETYNLQPFDVQNIRFSFDYIGIDNSTYTATFSCSLKSTVSNASERESVASIKANAGRFFATQDRMVTAADYTIFPTTVSDNVRKIKSVNRVHSGHSRFRDFHDPTATYSNAKQFIDDGYLYKTDLTTRTLINLPTPLNSKSILTRYILPLLNNSEIKNFYYHRHHYGISGAYDPWEQYSDTTDAITYYSVNPSDDTGVYRWSQSSKSNNVSTGYITYNSVVQRLGNNALANSPLQKLEQNSLIEFISYPYKIGYIEKIIVVNNGSGYTSAPTVTINGSGSGASAVATVVNGRITQISVTDSGLGYNSGLCTVSITGGGGSGATATVVVKTDTTWARIVNLQNDGLGENDSVGNPTGTTITGNGAVALNKIIPSGSRIKRIVPAWNKGINDFYESQILSFLNNNNSFGLRFDPSSKTWVTVQTADLPSNSLTNNNPNSWSRQFEGDTAQTGRDNSWLVRVNYTSNHWEILTRKTRYIFGSENEIQFNNLNFAETLSSDTLKPQRDNVLILDINKESSDSSVPLNENYQFNTTGFFTYADGYTDPYKVRVTLDNPDNDEFPSIPDAFHKIVKNETVSTVIKEINGFNYEVVDTQSTTPTNTYTGRPLLKTKFTRIADINQVIDPATTNIIDTFVLLNSYEQSFRAWAYYDGQPHTKPIPPTISELTSLFKSLDSKKSISDQIIYRPVKFKIIFGNLGENTVQARFNVTKTSNATMSDTEIKQNIILLINSYFSINNWDFGETFYFSELATFIHNNLIGQVAQIDIESVDPNLSNISLSEIKCNSDELFMPIVEAGNIIIKQNVNYNSTSLAANNGAVN